MPNTFTLQVNRRDPRPRSPRLRSLGSGSTSGSAVPGGQIPADIGQQISAAIAQLTERIANSYLSKLHDDVAAGRITFEQGLRALQTVNIEAADLVITANQQDEGGNIAADGNITTGGDIEAGGDISAGADLDVSGAAVIDGNLTAGSDLDVSGAAVIGGNLTAGGFIGSPSFASDLLGHGWRIGGPNNNGHGELDSLTLRRFLEVPELRYNRTEVHVGVDWHTHGAGLIEDVIHPDGFTQNRGIIKLKLEDGEVGAVAKDDYCMGIFHDEATPSNNYQPDPQQEETPVQDSHNGNFKFAGFMTVYFKVVAICDASGDTSHPDSRNQYFIYELRPESSVAGKEWHHSFHPQPSMSFACYANPNDEDRQSCIYATTDYIIMLVGMTDWTYDGDNIAYIRGYLNGFTIPERHLVDGEWVDTRQYKTLEGYGIAFGKAYMWGSIEQFNRAPFLISQQLYQVALNIAPSVVLNNEDWLDDYDWSIEPQNPSPNAPYLYSYWLQTFSDNSTKIVGPSLSGYDNSLFTAVLNKDIISLALSDWYVDGNSTDVLDFDVDAKLLRGNEQIPIVNATATSDIAGFSFDTPVSIDQNNIAHFHLHITGFVPQQVETVLAENNYVTFRLYADQTNYAEHTLAVVENRQGDTGADGDDAVSYTLEASQPTFNHTDNTGIDLRFYRSLSADKEACVGWFCSAEYDPSGQMVGTPRLYGGSGTEIKSIVDWRPQSGNASRVVFFAFVKHTDAVSYYGYLRGVYQTYDTEPVATCTLLLAEPVIDLLLSHQGTVTYPVDATRNPEAVTMKVYVRMMVNNVEWPLASLDTSAILGSPGSGMAYVGNDPAPDPTDDLCAYCEFETMTGTAVASLMQIYRITASVVYGGKTYQRSGDITFCAVTAGTSVQGRQGIQGCVIRLRGEWRSDILYVNESNLEVSTIRYIDVVQYTSNGTTKWYERTTYTDLYGLTDQGGSTTYQRPTNSNYWTECNSFEFIATQLLLAENAHIRFGQGNQLLIMDDSTPPNIVGGLSGYDGNTPSAYRLWMGASLPAEAPFSVTHEGALVAANINSQFQDLSYCSSSDADGDTYFNELLQYELKLANIRSGSGIIDAMEEAVSIRPRVYNIIANGTKIELPVTDRTFAGTRVLICNTTTDISSNSDLTEVVQEAVSGTRRVFLGAGLWYTKQETSVSGPSIWGLKYEEVSVIDFWSGVMEFVAVPDPDYADRCVWSVLHSSAACKQYNGKTLYSNNASR